LQDQLVDEANRMCRLQKMNRLQESLHFIDDNDLDDEDDVLMGFSDNKEDDEEDSQSRKPKTSNHVVFVDNEEEGKTHLLLDVYVAWKHLLTMSL
jgi:hypothetical protein